MSADDADQDGIEPAEACFAWPPEPPRPGEGLLGWLLSEASQQHVPSVGVILGRATSRVNLRAEQRVGARLDADALAAATLTEPALISGMLYPAVDARRVRFLNASIPSWHVESRRRRFSPATLAESGTSFAAWEHKFLPFCPESWEYLTDRCPGCCARQTWHWAVGMDGCPRCGCRLSARARRTVPEAWRSRLSVVAALTAGVAPADLGTAVPPLLRNADPGDVLELIHGMFPICGGRPLTLRTSRWWQRHPARLAATLADAVGLLEEWPRSILDRIAVVGGRRGPAGVGAGAVLRGELVRKDGPAAAILADLAATISTHGGGRLTGSDAGYSILTASRMLGVGTAITARARREGLLKSSPMLRNDEIVIGLDRADVDDAVEQLGHRASLWRVATALGLPRYAVEDLAVMGRLHASDHPYLIHRHGPHNFHEDDVRNFVRSIDARDIPKLESTTALKSLMYGIGGSLKPWASILEAIRSGDLPALLSDDTRPLAERIHVREEDLRRLLAAEATSTTTIRANDRELNRGDALDVLNLKQKHYKVVTEAFGGRDSIPVSEIVEVALRRISPSEVRARWRLDHRKAAALIRRHAPHAERDALGWDRRAIEAIASTLRRSEAADL